MFLSTNAQQGVWRVVFPKESKVDFTIRDTAYYRFTPTLENIDSVDVFLKIFLINTRTQSGRLFNLEKYYRQYAGLWRNGRNCIYVNAFCTKPEYFIKNTGWPRGGGECYFQMLVDISNKTVFNFRFNAPG